MLYVLQRALVRQIEAGKSAVAIIFTDKEMKTLHQAYTKMSNLELRKRLDPKFSKALRNLADSLNLGSSLEPIDDLFSLEEGGLS